MTRDEIIDLVKRTFVSYEIKVVSKTDVEKGAYVPNKAQRDIMSAVGFMPEHNHPIHVKELFTNKIFTVSYYPSERQGSGRSPEVRMGLHDLISYISTGSEILFTHDENDVYIYNLARSTGEEVEDNIYTQIDMGLLRERALQININPNQLEQTIRVYPRNSTLRNYIKRRAEYSCEMPDCNYHGFLKKNGEPYIEIHHIIPLSEGGKDSIDNTVALCPNCHRAIHYSENREGMKQILLDYLSSV